jgi:hypothetical protein
MKEPSLVMLAIEILGIAVVLAGWGVLLASAVKRFAGVELRGLSWFQRGLIGVTATYLVSGLVLLVMPLTGPIDLIFVAAGLFASVRTAWKERSEAATDWFLIAAAIAIVAVIAFGTIRTPPSFDNGLYYLQVAREFETEPMALGLANVHRRFGFNSAIMPVAAVFNGPLFGLDGLFLVAPAILLLTLGACLRKLLDGIRARRIELSHAFAASGLIIWLVIMNETAFSFMGLSPSADLPAACFVFVAFLGLLDFAAGGQDQAPANVVLISLLAATAVASKLAAAPVMAIAVAPLLFHRLKMGPAVEPAALYRGLAIAGGVLTLWLTHNLVLSGCALYPLPSTCVEGLPWSVDLKVAARLTDEVRTWARAPGAPIEFSRNGYGWLGYWKEHMLAQRQFVYVLLWALPVLLAGAVLVRRICPRAESTEEESSFGRTAAFTANFIAFGGLLFWFLQAPDPRFAIGLFVAAASSLTAFAATSGRPLLIPDSATGRLLIGAGSLLALLLVFDVQRVLASPLGPPTASWRNIPKPRVHVLSNKSGFQVARPIDGQQCFSVEPICTPDFSAVLEKTKFGGMRAYIWNGTQRLLRPPSSSTAAESPDVVWASSVWGAEATERGGESYDVRWLQQRAEFKILGGDKARKVRLKLLVATDKTPRNAWFEQDGAAVGSPVKVERGFWVNGETALIAEVALKPGNNQLAVVSDGPGDAISPGRFANLLAIGGIAVELIP